LLRRQALWLLMLWLLMLWLLMLWLLIGRGTQAALWFLIGMGTGLPSGTASRETAFPLITGCEVRCVHDRA